VASRVPSDDEAVDLRQGRDAAVLYPEQFEGVPRNITCGEQRKPLKSIKNDSQRKKPELNQNLFAKISLFGFFYSRAQLFLVHFFAKIGKCKTSDKQ